MLHTAVLALNELNDSLAFIIVSFLVGALALGAAMTVFRERGQPRAAAPRGQGAPAPFAPDAATAAGDTPEHSDVPSDRDAAGPAER